METIEERLAVLVDFFVFLKLFLMVLKSVQIVNQFGINLFFLGHEKKFPSP